MKERKVVEEIIDTISLCEYDSWDDSQLIEELTRLKDECKNKCRMEIQKEYGYYHDVSYHLVIYNLRPETDEECKARMDKEKEQSERLKFQEIERAKEILRKAKIKNVY